MTNQKSRDKNKPKVDYSKPVEPIMTADNVIVGYKNVQKKTKELKCIEDLIKTGWKVLYFKIKGDNLDVVGENGVQLLNYFEETLTQQRTELLEEILNLECLKEEKITKNIFSITQLESRNKLRNEIKEEILENLKDIEIGEFEGWDLAHKFNCCPGDDMADAYNQALKDVIKLIKKL